MQYKIIQASRYYIPIVGGQETYIENLHQILVESGYQSTVVQQTRSLKDCPSHVKPLLYIPGFFNRFIPDADWFQFNVALSLSRFFLSKADVIICHYPFHYPALRWHKRVIVLSHGIEWLNPPRKLSDHYRVHAMRMCWKDRSMIVANDTNFLRTLGLDIQPRSCEFQQVEQNVWYLPNCVDTNHFKPLDMERKNIILVPRNIRKVRGIHLAIQAFQLLIKERSEYQMWIAGGPLQGEYYDYCKDLVEELKLKEKVLFLGNIPWDSLVHYYNQSKLSLIPTIELEGTSLSALESMACKTPVVSTDVAGLKDLPTLKAEVDPHSLASKMLEILENWDSYSNKQYEAVLTTFNLNRWKDAWLNVIRQTLEQDSV